MRSVTTYWEELPPKLMFGLISFYFKRCGSLSCIVREVRLLITKVDLASDVYWHEEPKLIESVGLPKPCALLIYPLFHWT